MVTLRGAAAAAGGPSEQGGFARDRERHPCHHKFCPDAGLLATAGMRAGSTASLLRALLKPVAAIMLVAAGAYFVRDLLVRPDGAPLSGFTVLAVIGLGTALLFSSRCLALRQLRAVELALFVAMSGNLLSAHHGQVLQVVSGGEPGLVLAAWNQAVVSFILLMAGYAIFVPNSWQRAALMIVPMAAAPVGLVAFTRARYPAVAELTAGLMTAEMVTDLLFPLGIAVTVCLLGTALITRFRDATYHARLANLYDLEEKIGSGGMGEVWRARHQTLTRSAAIKIIRPDLLGKGSDGARLATRRFEREARATAALRSPNTVEIYDYGVTQEGVFYYVMEYLDGLDLETLVNRHGPLPPARAIHILQQVCASLEEAHENGLIHRDVKPANIYVCRMGSQLDFVKVLDFGLVKEQHYDGKTELTVDGLTTGTPAFLSPEMALQDRPVTAATDVYSLGCVAYWLLTGKLLFEHETPMAMVVDHVKTAPVPPSRRTELTVPERLDEIVLKCLAKDPGDRFTNMRELSDALETVPLAGPAWDRRRAEEWWQLHQPLGGEPALARAS